MKAKIILSLFLLLFSASFLAIAQEDQIQIREQPESPASVNESPLNESPASTQEQEKPKKDKKKKEKVKKKDIGPSLIADHKKDKVQRYFKVGETIKYKSKTSKKKVKGVLEEIKPDKIVVDGKEVKIKDLILVGKSFGKTMGWRSAGLAKFAVGTGVTAAGVLIIAFSGNQYSLDNSNVVWSTLGVVVGSGVSFVGIHLMVRGGKGVFQNSDKKLKRGWTFKTKM